jgi:cephalosporin-C deacetylase-like acetyl esterase
MRVVISSGVAALIALVGCVSYTSSPAAPAPDAVFDAMELPSHPSAEYEKHEVVFKNRMVDEEESSLYRVRYIRFPSYGENGQEDNLVTGRYYESKRPGKKPLVIIVPIPAGHTYPAEKMTAYLKSHSMGEINIFNMAIEKDVIDWTGLAAAVDESAFMDRLENSAEREWTTVIDIRRTLDWAEARPEIDAQRIGLMGFSHGGFVAAGVAVQEPRLAATVLVMAGALLHQPMVRCSLGRSEGMRSKALSEFGWTEEELESRIESEFSYFEPANFPGRVDPSKVLIVEAAKDDCIPETGREALWETMGRPQRILLDYKHKQAFLSMTPLRLMWLRHRIWEFLQRSLDIDSQSLAAL